MLTSLLKAAVVLALVSIAIFFLFLTFSVRHVVVRFDRTLDQLSWTAAAAQKSIENVDPAIAALPAAIDQVKQSVANLDGELKPAIAEIKPMITDLHRTIEIAGGTLNVARDTLRNEQESIREANQETIATLATIPPAVDQAQRDLATLNLAIAETRPLLAESTKAMANTAEITADLAKIVDGATKPQPWYKRAWGYVWAPVKLAAVFLK